MIDPGVGALSSQPCVVFGDAVVGGVAVGFSLLSLLSLGDDGIAGIAVSVDDVVEVVVRVGVRVAALFLMVFYYVVSAYVTLLVP